MKKLLVGLCAIFICTFALAHSVEWYVDSSLYQTTTCDAGDSITPPTAPTKYGYHFVKWSEYTQLEYIESTGTQYIDTGYYTKANTTIKAKLYTSSVGTKNWFGGTAGIDEPKGFVFNSASDTSVEYLRGASGWQTVSADNVVGTPFTIEFAPAYININEQKISDVTTSNTTDTLTLCLFVRNGGTAYIYGRIYYFEIWEDNNLIQNLIPARRNSDNVLGMYDTVSGQFFTNAGTGEFIAGPEVGGL